MNILLFVMTLVASFVVVRIGAIAFQITGLEWTLAKFQALSCFTGTGFTTKEAELITNNSQRRKIASFLIILGHAGLVALIATFANSLRPQMLMPNFKIPFLDLVFPSSILPWINLIVLCACIYLVYAIFTHSKLTKNITDILKSKIIKTDIVRPVSFEELQVSTGGYGVASIKVTQGSFMAGKKVEQSGMRSKGINILAVERKGQIQPNPSKDTEIKTGDILICFGKLDDMREKLYPEN